MSTAGIILYDDACRAVAAAKSVDEVLEIKCRADAVRAYAFQAKNRTLELDAAEIRFRAERRLGEILAALKGSDTIKHGRPGNASKQVKLRDLGVDKKLSSRAQSLARSSTEAFEAQIQRWRREQQDCVGSPVSTRIAHRSSRRMVVIEADADPYGRRILDGRRIGDLSVGSLRRLAERALVEHRLLALLAGHCRSDQGALVRDVIRKQDLEDYIDRAERRPS